MDQCNPLRALGLLGLVPGLVVALAGCSVVSSTDSDALCAASADSCFDDEPAPSDSMPPVSDSMGTPPSGGTDPGDGSGTGTGTGTGSGSGTGTGSGSGTGTGTGSGTGTSAVGCDAAAGECDAWELAVLRGVRAAQTEGGCETAVTGDPRLDRVAEANALAAAEADALLTNTRALFDDVYATGVEIFWISAAFSVTTDGPENVLARWRANPRTAPLFMGCDRLAGIGIATNAGSGKSYVTLILAY